MRSEYNLPSRSPFQKIYDLMNFFISYRPVTFSCFTPTGLFPMEASEGGGDPIILIPTPCFLLSVPSLPLAADADFHGTAPVKAYPCHVHVSLLI